MTKQTVKDEVQVLRFFEREPIEKAQIVFNIVTDKMRERLQGQHQGHGEQRQQNSSAGKRRAKSPEASAAESTEQTI